MTLTLNVPTLTTERLTLRAPRHGDAAIYAAFFASSQASGSYGGPLRPDQAFRVLCNDVGHWALMGHGKWILERTDDATVLGGCGLVKPDGWPSAELTWWLLPEHRGSGYATEASRAAIQYGYETLKWDVVETHMQDENTAARELTIRLGGSKSRRVAFPDAIERDVFAFPRAAGHAP